MDQALVLVVLVVALGLFLWGRWRYDLVALLALLALAVPGIVGPGDVFAGFGHPAVVTVAAVLVVSNGLERAGLVGRVARRLRALRDRPGLQLPVLSGAIALASGFMNNVGALALLMPVGIRVSHETERSPSRVLMPMAFCSLLGGLLTVIGTPPNLIIAQFRAEAGEQPFGMFDFLPVGAGVALVGTVLVVLLAPRLVPERRSETEEVGLFDLGSYLVELRVDEDSGLVGRRLRALRGEGGDAVALAGLVRDGELLAAPLEKEVVQAGDRVVVEAAEEVLRDLLDRYGLEPVASDDPDAQQASGGMDPGSLELVEAVVAPGAGAVGRSAAEMQLRSRHGVALLAVSRRGESLRDRPSQVGLETGDVVLLQGEQDAVSGALDRLGLLPLADREVPLGSRRRLALAGGLFVGAVALTATGVLAVEVSFVAAALGMVLLGVVRPDEAYRSIDWSVIVLIGAMLPVGDALESTGGVATITALLEAAAGDLSTPLLLVALMAVTMALSNVVNNAAAAVVVAPVAIQLADGVGASVDPFLMAVAVSASLPLLTPIGHQSNTLVMGPGGYHFGDYWRLGLPLSLVSVLVAVPLLLWAWPPG